MHSNYGSSILDYDDDDLDNMCSDVVEGFLAGPTDMDWENLTLHG